MGRTAEEVMALRQQMIDNDPEYRAKVEAVEAQRAQRRKELLLAQRPIIADLRHVGIEVDSVWDLVNTSEPYPAALPVLIAYFEREGFPDRVIEGLGRALAVKPAAVYWDRIQHCYLTATRDSGRQVGAAVALSAIATYSQIDEIVGFLSRDELGESRLYFIRPLLEIAGQRGRDVVEALKNDKDFGTEARAALKLYYKNKKF